MKFDIGTILSVAHSKLLTEIGNVYKILNFMLDDNLFTHQLPRAGRFCAKFLIAQHPKLERWAEFDEQITPENYKEYLEKAKVMFGKGSTIGELKLIRIITKLQKKGLQGHFVILNWT